MKLVEFVEADNTPVTINADRVTFLRHGNQEKTVIYFENGYSVTVRGDLSTTSNKLRMTRD